MEDNMKNIIPIIILSLVLLSCSKDEEGETTITLICSGTSTGSGPTFGNVTLEEATYLSTCFQGKKVQMEFIQEKKNQIKQFCKFQVVQSLFYHVRERF